MAKQDHILPAHMPHASTDPTRIKRLLNAGAATRFGNEEEENGREGKGRGRAKSWGSFTTLLRWPCFIHVPLMASPEEVRCGTPHPHSFVLSTCDVRVLIDRRTVVTGNEDFHML